MKFKNSVIKAAAFVRANMISFSVIIVCAALVVTMSVLMIPDKEEVKPPIPDIRAEVYAKGIEVCGKLTSKDSMIELARIYASGADVNASMYFSQMREFEEMCKTAPEEYFFSAVSAAVGLNLDAASLQSDHEYEMSAKYQEKAERLFEEIKLASAVDELDEIIKRANAFKN